MASFTIGQIDGPCDDDRVCLAQPASDPVACTLDPDDRHDRLDDWGRVLGAATGRLAMPSGGVRIEFGDGVDVAELATLVVAEQACCTFFQFAITVDHRGVALQVDAPDEAGDLMRDMFGIPS